MEGDDDMQALINLIKIIFERSKDTIIVDVSTTSRREAVNIPSIAEFGVAV